MSISIPSGPNIILDTWPVCYSQSITQQQTPSSAYLNSACACHWEQDAQNRGDTTVWTTAFHFSSGEGHIWFGGYTFTESTPVMLQHGPSNLFVQEADMSSGASCLSRGPHSTSHIASWGPFRAGEWRWGASTLENGREIPVLTQHSEKWAIETSCTLSPQPSTFVDVSASEA